MSRALWRDKILGELEAAELDLDLPIFVCPCCQGVSNNVMCAEVDCQATLILAEVVGDDHPARTPEVAAWVQTKMDSIVKRVERVGEEWRA